MKRIFLFLLVVCLAGCGPTYPKKQIKESIVKVCKKEYKLDVKVDTIGKTIVIYLPLPDLIDMTFAITKTASEKINDVILTVSRVALSTDAKYDFYCVIAHDVRIPEIQIVIIKSVDDVKRFMLNDISRDDYSKRMLIDIRLSPQAQKEKSIKQVFEKMNLDKKWQDQVMDEFFRSQPTGLGEIGYWDGRFYIKDITLTEFLAEQIASRIKMEFREDKKLSEEYVLKSSKGRYHSKTPKRFFRFEISADAKFFNNYDTGEVSKTVFLTALKVAGQALHAYKFTDFDYIEIVSTLNGQKIRVRPEQLEGFRKNKVKFEEIVK